MEIPYTDELLANVLLSPKVADTNKRSLLSDFARHQPTLAARSSGAWMTASARMGMNLTPAQVIALGEAGARAKEVLDFLLRERSRLTAPDITTLLPYCGAPYTGLASANGAKFQVPFSESLRVVLQTLKDANLVHDFRKKREHFDVHMAG